MTALTLDSDLVHYEVLGRGRPVLLLHGWLGSWRYWTPTLQRLQGNYRVYALDFFGFGNSAKNPTRYGVDAQVAMLVSFLNELGVPKAALVGHGLGALVGAELARLYPDRVARAMLIAAPLLDPGDMDRRAKYVPPVAPAIAPAPVEPAAPSTRSSGAAMRAALLESARARVVPRAIPVADAALARAPVPAPPAEARATGAAGPDFNGAEPPRAVNPLPALLGSPSALLNRAFRRSEPEYEKLQSDEPKTDARAIQAAAAAFDTGRFLDTARGLACPLALLHGQDDPILPAPSDAVWSYLTQDRDAVVPVVLPGVRHFPMLEYDLFARLLAEFLDAPDVTRLEIKERWRRRTR